MTEKSKCGYVAIIGRPNVGKSTLLNYILQKKISITSPKPQTTRHQILGIKTENDVQTIYIDTPGMHQAGNRAMNRYLNRLATSVIPDADVVVFTVDALHWKSEDEAVLEKIIAAKTKSPVIAVLNKVDELSDKQLLLPLIENMQAKYNFAHFIPLSAKKGENVSELEKEIAKYLPDGPHLFPDEQFTDKTERFQVAEIIREKVIQMTSQELPYSTSVEIESIVKKKKIVEVSAIVWVERASQKPIVIGASGTLLKKIGTAARKDMEKLLDSKVFLRLWVKVKEGWTDDDKILKSLGYE